MNFDLLHRRLLELARERVRNGEISESALARLTGVSQPHMHNVLKGARMLSMELADKLLRQFDLNAESLISNDVRPAAPFQAIPLMAGALGPSMREFKPGLVAGSVFVPLSIVRGAQNPVAAVLDEEGCMAPRLSSGDVVVIDQAPEVRMRIETDGIYVVRTAAGPRLRLSGKAASGCTSCRMNARSVLRCGIRRHRVANPFWTRCAGGSFG